MSRIKVTDNTDEFIKKVAKGADRALEHMAIDVEILAKTKNVPVKDGKLQNTIVHVKRGFLKWVVPADTEYARFQEFGGDGQGKVVRNYSTAGTGKHYMKKSGDAIKSKATTYYKQHMRNIKV